MMVPPSARRAPLRPRSRPAIRATPLLGIALGWLAAMPVAGQPARSALPEPALCERAAARAAEATGVPLSILRAVALTETGRRLPGSDAPLSPWPWAINEGGAGTWPATRAEAEARARDLMARGVSNFDVGCFQINRRWHGAAFPSVSAMFEPEANALYAARLLRRLFDRSGDWRAAVGAYHSATPDLAEAYLARFTAIHARLAAAPGADGAGGRTEGAAIPVLAAVPRENPFPLLRAGGRGQGASLVPAVSGGPRLIGD